MIELPTISVRTTPDGSDWIICNPAGATLHFDYQLHTDVEYIDGGVIVWNGEHPYEQETVGEIPPSEEWQHYELPITFDPGGNALIGLVFSLYLFEGDADPGDEAYLRIRDVYFEYPASGRSFGIIIG